jgi:putative transposase
MRPHRRIRRVASHHRKEPLRVQARSLACYRAVRELGLTTVAISKELGLCQTAVTKAVARGNLFAEKRALNLQE